ncbi:MAG: TetR/AcrR family transcriptional regulator [Flavobacterium sp.]
MKEDIKGKSRNKEHSKQLLLDAVGEILRTKGYSELKVNQIAATAGLDKKLIYNYFGSKDNLVGTYIHSKDFWSNVKEDNIPVEITDGGHAFSKIMLQQQFDFLHQNEELQKVLLWRLSEAQPFLQELTENQEKVGEILLQAITDPHFKEKAQDYRAIMAILISGIYYLNLYGSVNGSIFCGIDMNSEYGRNKVQDALSFLIDKTYESL